jgi:regulatory protein
MTADQPLERVLQKAYRLLSLRARSEKELRQKLALKGFEKVTVDAVVARLYEQGYLGDETFARQWARHLAVDKLLGDRKIAASLAEKGIERNEAHNAIRVARREISEAEALRKLLEKKRRPEGPAMDERLKRRLFRSLFAKGFPTGLIYEVMRSEEDWQYDDGQ